MTAVLPHSSSASQVASNPLKQGHASGPGAGPGPLPRERVLTGIKPTGDLHLGNYQGAILPIVTLSQATDRDVILMCADWHGLTDKNKILGPGLLAPQILSALLVCGFNTSDHILMRQSDFPQIQEISWYLSCATSVGLLERAHAYKDALANGKEATAGLFFYPALMAADIVTFDASLVPVGKDQLQHLEMAADMARYFNVSTNTPALRLPHPLVQQHRPLLMGIDGERKMSKSYSNEIPLFGTKKEIEKRVKEIKTDSKGLNDPKDPETCLLFQIFCSFASAEAQGHMRERLAVGTGYGYGHAKADFLDEHERVFGSKREEFFHYAQSPAELWIRMEAGTQRAHVMADAVRSRARAALGFRDW